MGTNRMYRMGCADSDPERFKEPNKDEKKHVDDPHDEHGGKHPHHGDGALVPDWRMEQS